MPSTGYQSRARVLTPEMNQGDLLPPLAIALSSELGPVDVSDASRVRVLGWRSGVLVIDRDTSGDDDGLVVMPWESSDVDTPAPIGFQVEASWEGAPLTEDPPGSGLYLIPEGMTGTGGLYEPAGSGTGGLYPVAIGGQPGPRTFPSGGLVYVRINADPDSEPTSLGLTPVPGWPGYYTFGG